MMTVKSLSLAYGSQVLFNDASLHLNPKERIGLIGRNGHGKSTLFRILTGDAKADEVEGRMPKGYLIGRLEQHIRFTEPTLLAEACTGLRADEAHDEWRAKIVLAGLGFSEEDLWRAPAEFSGGFQVRLQLAKVLLGRPNLLLLDEPTNYLDIVALRWLREFLVRWDGEVMLITHDRAFMDSVSTHTMGIHRTKIRKYEGGTENFYAQIEQEEEIHEKTRMAQEKARAKTELFITRFRAKARLAGLVQSRVKMLEKQETLEELPEIASVDFRFRAAGFDSKSMLDAKRISFGYGDGPGLFSDLSLHVGPRERIGVVGPNGRGKSTLLRVLIGELTPRAGEIRRHPSLRVGYFGQTNVDRLSPQRTVFEEVMAADAAVLPQRARDVAGLLGFSGEAQEKRIEYLSGGERARVLLARILVTRCHLLVLDEPTNHLDQDSAEALLEAAEEFPGSVIMVTHSEFFLDRLARRLVVFDGGERPGARLVEGGYKDFISAGGWGDGKNQKKR